MRAPLLACLAYLESEPALAVFRKFRFAVAK